MKYYLANDIGRYHEAYDTLEEALEVLKSMITYDIKYAEDRAKGGWNTGRTDLYRIEVEEG